MKTTLTILLILLMTTVTLSNNKPVTPELTDIYIIEESLEVEDWMTVPFPIYEEPIELEDWMMKPFVSKN